MNFDPVEKIAAAILYEGYLLYPYRPTAIKNRQRWNFGTLYPRVYAQAQRPEEPFRLVAECLALAGPQTTLDVRLRFLQLAVERTADHTNLRLENLEASPLSLSVAMEGDLEIQLLISAQTMSDGSCKFHLEVQNNSRLPGAADATRDEALPFSLASAHLLLGLTGGEFVSLLDPEERYSASSKTCGNVGVFPVLVGEGRSMMLCSPIILYDYPQIAPESAGDFFDGTEMDEMLTLRVLTLTDAEKQEMRNGDPRAKNILERTEALTEEAMLQAHGVIRGWNPFAEEKAPPESVRVFCPDFRVVDLRVGDRVRLCPRKNADILDMALAGKVALIEAIEQDFEDNIQFAVVLDDDPGREFGMMRQPGHRFFFAPQEVEPV